MLQENLTSPLTIPSTQKRTHDPGKGSLPIRFESFHGNDEDFYDTFDDGVTLTEYHNATVHDSLIEIFKYIGDLFDDDDLS